MPKLSEGVLCVVSPLDFAEACFSVPAIRALKRLRPSEDLKVLCPESLMVFWETVSELDDVVAYPDKMPARKMARWFMDQMLECSSVILWEAGDAAKAMAKAKVPQRIGYPATGLEKFLTEPVSLVSQSGPIEHRVRYYLNLVQELGADAFVPENFKTVPLHLEGVEKSDRCKIAWTLESEYGEAYQWGVEMFEEVKSQVEKKVQTEVEWVECGKRTGEGDADLIKLLSECSVLLACDGEVAHLAAHFGLPAVVLFGPGEPRWKRPLGKQNRVIREHVACSPCYLSKCPLDGRCQSEIKAETVSECLAEVVLECLETSKAE